MIFISILILIVAIALPSYKKQLTPVLFTRISSIVFIYSAALSINALYIQSIGSGIGIYSGLFQVTFISQLFDTFLLLIASLILIAWPLSLSANNLNNSNEGSGLGVSVNSYIMLKEEYKTKNKIIIDRSHYPIEYSLIVLFSTLGASLLVSSADLVSMYLSIELQSFGVYILSTLYRDSESSTKAGLKYFLLGALSSCFILLGSGLVYSYTGLTNFESIYSLISVSDSNAIIQGLTLGFILIFIGFLFKIAAAPLHNWAPDVYEDTPNIVTIWLTIMPKISIIILLLELQVASTQTIGIIDPQLIYSSSIFNSNNEIIESIYSLQTTLLDKGISVFGINTTSIIKNLLLISSLLSLIIGTIVGLAQTRIKRLLAYSTISHVGFILLALAISTEQSIESLLFYIIQYSITNLNTFLIIIALGYIIHQNWNKSTLAYFTYYKDFETDLKFLCELRGQFFANPLLSLSLSICLFSMAGIPPLIGFFSKQFVLYSAIESGYYFMAFVCIIVSVVSASYYLKIIKLLHMETEGVLQDNNLELKVQQHTSDNTSSLRNDSNRLTRFARVNRMNEGVESNTFNSAYSSGRVTNLHSFLISSLTLSILLFVLKPSIILNSTQLLSLSLFNF